ncbi:hypothetical protein [Streptomyces sp. NBC_00663]|uniref:hypothetical protein n=1 Tax=Streptomyces sp. NBC_00663 TaxID=2975801 RepID=UPI002E31DD86|nr:hypothetical protein [Streptomyces sp. NBC_00663]
MITRPAVGRADERARLPGPDPPASPPSRWVAGVGKGRLFRRYGDRNGLLPALLDDVEGEFYDRYTSGPPPLGPGSPSNAGRP